MHRELTRNSVLNNIKDFLYKCLYAMIWVENNQKVILNIAFGIEEWVDFLLI